MNKNSALSWSVMLMATCLFGVGLGLSLGYAIFSPRAPRPAAPSSASPSTNAQPSTQRATISPPAATRQIGAQPAAIMAPDDGYWAARHLFIAVNGQWLADGVKQLFGELRPGGVLLQDVNLGSRAQTFALVKEIKTATGLGEGLGDLPLVAVQQEGGPFNLLGVENAPSAQSLGQNGDPELARKLGQQYGEACVGRGIAIAFAPVLDVFEPGAINPGFAVRTFGMEHTQVARIGLAMADGLRQGGVLPVVKHFPGYGAATYGSDGLLVALNKDAAGLGRLLYPFDQAVRRGVPGMLVGHVAVPALDPENPRRSAALSPVLVNELLRARWGYDGVIVADDVALNSMTRSLGPEQAAVQALAAGCDAVIMLDPDPSRIRSVSAAIAAAVERGTLSREKLQQSASRLQRWQEAIGNLNPIRPNTSLERVAQAVPPPAIDTLPPPSTPPAGSLGPARSSADNSAQPSPTATMPEEKSRQEALAPGDVGQQAPPPPDAEGKSRIEHTMREGEDLASVARSYSVSVEDLVRWNALESSGASAGTTLTVYLGDVAKPADASLAEKIAAAAKSREPLPSAERDAPVPEAPAAADVNTVAGKIVYTVAEGDTLGSVAGKYRVSAAEITRWNGLKSDAIGPGQTLTIFLPGVPVDDDAAPVPAVETTAAEPPPPDIPTETYVVQAGDTVSKIAREHNTTRDLVLQLNRLKDANDIKTGQKLKVPKPAVAPAAP